MKIIATSDWHLGNIFHGNDRQPEHKHFLKWLLSQIEEQQPDALLIAGDVFDNGNPSAASQSLYYSFLADASEKFSTMQIVIIAGNHDSANRLEAPRPLLARHHVEVRGVVNRTWKQDGEKGDWVTKYDDLMIPVKSSEGDEVIVLAVPYLRNDVIQNTSYSKGVMTFLKELTSKAREKYPDKPLVMMAHMYAQGAIIAQKDASEKIVIGGAEEVSMDGWADHPDYLTCGHIHKRQHIWNTDWARYSGSVLPMSFAEVDYRHGVDLVTILSDGKHQVEFLEYEPQHKLVILPKEDEELTPKKLMKLIDAELADRIDGKLDDDFVYVMLKVKLEKVNNDDLVALEEKVNAKNAVHCRTTKINSEIDQTTISGAEQIRSVDDIINRDPLDTLKEAYAVKYNNEMSEHQVQMLKDLLNSITSESDNS